MRSRARCAAATALSVRASKAGPWHADFRIANTNDLSMLRMTRLMTRSEDDVLNAFQRCVFNVVFNKRDDHTKRFSYLLNPQGRWQLTPRYDLSFLRGAGRRAPDGH